MKLSIELVPQTAWYANLRQFLRPKDWDFLRKRQYKLANGVCEICGDRGKKQGRRHGLECMNNGTMTTRNISRLLRV